MSGRLDVSLRLNDPQFRAYANVFDPTTGYPYRRRTHFWGWGRGVGKTHFARANWWLLIAAYDFKQRSEALEPFRGVRITSLCPTLKQWKDINVAGIESELGASGRWHFLGGKYDRQSGQVTFPGGSVIRPFPATEYNARTARGLRTDVLDAEELDDIDASVYDGVAIPWLSEPWSLGIELLRGTPTRGRHGLWYRSLETCRIAQRLRDGQISETEALELEQALAIREVFENLPLEDWPLGLPQDPDAAALTVLRGYFGSHATYRDAPETVSPLAVARAKATTPKPVFEREWEANPDAGEGLVYPFDDEFHVRTPPPLSAFSEFHCGVDHGWTDPGVLLLGGIRGHGEDAELWLLDEHYETEVPTHLWDERAREWRYCERRPVKFWADRSRQDRIDALKRQGLSVQDSDSAPGSIRAGIARVADMLFIRQTETQSPAYGDSVRRWSRVYVAPRCINTIREFGLYRRKRHPDGSFSEEPEDRNNHAMDALRYIVLGRFGRLPNYRHEASGR